MYGLCDGEGLLGVRVPDKSLPYDENFNFSVIELGVRGSLYTEKLKFLAGWADFYKKIL